MVFVFGIDVPLIELLFIYVILIIFALVIVLVEIAKLRKLLMLEKMNTLQATKGVKPKPNTPKLHKDLEKLEKEIDLTSRHIVKSPSLDPKLAQYVEKSLKRGLDKKTIRENLLAIGWTKTDVDNALA